MNWEIFLASLAVLAGWLQYRLTTLDERKRIKNSLRALLTVVGFWVGSSYSKDIKKSEWFDPGKSVYKIDYSSIPGFVNSNLISEEFSKLLTYFMQLVKRFNQLIDMYNQYIYSDLSLFFKASSFVEDYLMTKDGLYLAYEDCYKRIDELKEKDKDLFNYFTKTYKINENIHVDGIGDETYYGEGFPKLHKCYLELDCALKNEEFRKRGFLNDDFRYIIGDVVLFLIPVGIIAFSIIKFLIEFILHSKILILIT